MQFRWVQTSTRVGEMQRWFLMHKGTRRIVMEIRLSPYAEDRINGRMRRKIKRAYELYYQKVWWYNTYRFF
jgi:type II secretory pathway predicted ATPase ExeA